ncbi:MAG: sulfurtransferase [Halofilum sp. (in: g-proteobacteria)]
MSERLPLLVQPEELAARLGEPGLRVIDLSPGDIFRQQHVPGSVHLPYGEIVASRPPVGGLLPEQDLLERVLRSAGIDSDARIVALDAEGGGAAGRLMWTLEIYGFDNVSLLDGGLQAWVNEGFPTETGAPASVPDSDLTLDEPQDHIADARFIMERLDHENFLTLDARSPEEYAGTAVRAARGGHIPGAVHYEWTRAMDRSRNLRLRPADELRDELARLGITPEREVAVYCHTHHRSALSYAMLRILGFERVHGYPGSWSDWGNRDDTPVE